MGTLVMLPLISAVRLALIGCEVVLEVVLEPRHAGWAVRREGKRRQMRRKKGTKERMVQ